MDRKPMIAFVALLSGCTQFQPPARLFEVPQAVAVLQPENGGPFLEPVGFVANGIGGQIPLLSLKQGRPLTDEPSASFLPANQLATGDRRLLSSIAIHATDTANVTVFVGDRAFGELLVLPYLVGIDGLGPVEGLSASISEAMWVQGPMDTPVPVDLSDPEVVKQGWTTTETWTFTYVGDQRWQGEGSRSGLQPDVVIAGDEALWSAEDRRLQLRIAASDAQVGDQFQFETDNGLTALDVGGAPLALEMAPDQSVLAMIVQDRTTDLPRLTWFDPVGQTVLGDVTLPAGAEPHRLSVTEAGGLLVADRARSAFYEVPWGASDAVEHPVPWPTLDVAGLVTEAGDRRYVVPLDASSLWRYDPANNELLDVNPAREGLQGVAFNAPVQGIEAMPLPYRAPELDDDEARVVTEAVAISLTDGRVVFAHADTGCLVQTPDGPSTSLAAQSGIASIDVDSGNIPASANFLARFDLQVDGRPNLVTVNSCAGIAQPESWLATFDQNTSSWELEGTLSGVQSRRVLEDQRYVSDDGAVSFLLRSGAVPSVDGWSFSFSVLSGVATATGDVDLDGDRDISLAVSGDPVFFFYRVGEPGPVSSTREAQDIRPFVLVAGASSDRVGRVDPSDDRAPVVEVSWE